MIQSKVSRLRVMNWVKLFQSSYEHSEMFKNIPQNFELKTKAGPDFPDNKSYYEIILIKTVSFWHRNIQRN